MQKPCGGSGSGLYGNGKVAGLPGGIHERQKRGQDFNDTDFVVLTHGQQYSILCFLFDRSRRGMCLSVMRAGNMRLTDLFHFPWPLMVTCMQSILRTQLGN